MSHIYDSTSRYRPHVRWDDEIILSSPGSNHHLSTIKKRGQRISLNASLPFHSKLNIRVQANRFHHDNSNENNRVKATASIQRLDPRYEGEHLQAVRQTYLQHHSTLPPDDFRRMNSSIRYEKFPLHRQISLPISLPVDQRLFLYIRDGEIFARC
jgi:hypothetical protein